MHCTPANVADLALLLTLLTCLTILFALYTTYAVLCLTSEDVCAGKVVVQGDSALMIS